MSAAAGAAPARHHAARRRAALVDRRQVGRARLAPDHRRAGDHRDRLPDAERPLPHGLELREPDRAVGGLHHDRHGHRLRAAAGRDRPVGRLRVGRGGRDRHHPPDPRRQRGADRGGDRRRARRRCGDRGLPRHPVRQGGHPLVRGHARGADRLERGGAAVNRQPRHRDPPGRLHHRPGQRVPRRRDGVDADAGLRRALRGHAAERDPRAPQGGTRAGALPAAGAARGRARHRALRRRVRGQPGPRHPLRGRARGGAARLLDASSSGARASVATSTPSAATPRRLAAPGSTSTGSASTSSRSAR